MKRIIILLAIFLISCSPINELKTTVPEPVVELDRCELGQGLICEQAEVKEDNRIGLLLKNDVGKDLQVKKIIISENEINCTAELDFLFEEGETVKFYVKECGTLIEGGIKASIQIDWYDPISGSKFSRKNSGELRIS